MRLRGSLVSLVSVLVAAVACGGPPGEWSGFVRAGDAQDGVYVFDIPFSDSLAVYDLWIYSRTGGDALEGVRMNVRLTSPDGDSFAETVYMSRISADGDKELYRSGLRVSRPGVWRLSARPVDVGGEFCGMGVICTKDGTR